MFVNLFYPEYLNRQNYKQSGWMEALLFMPCALYIIYIIVLKNTSVTYDYRASKRIKISHLPNLIVMYVFRQQNLTLSAVFDSILLRPTGRRTPLFHPS